MFGVNSIVRERSMSDEEAEAAISARPGLPRSILFGLVKGRSAAALSGLLGPLDRRCASPSKLLAGLRPCSAMAVAVAACGQYDSFLPSRSLAHPHPPELVSVSVSAVVVDGAIWCQSRTILPSALSSPLSSAAIGSLGLGIRVVSSRQRLSRDREALESALGFTFGTCTQD